MKKRTVPTKNYFILLLLLVGVVLSCMYITSWFRINQKQNLPKGVMASYLKELKIEEIADYVVENPSFILYVSESNDENITVVENKIKKYIEKQNISSNFVYLDVKDLDKEIIINELSKFGETKEHVFEISPNIYYIKDGEISNILYHNERNFNSKEAIKFIEKQDINK
jgi:hypothetical protein